MNNNVVDEDEECLRSGSRNKASVLFSLKRSLCVSLRMCDVDGHRASQSVAVSFGTHSNHICTYNTTYTPIHVIPGHCSTCAVIFSTVYARHS